MILLILNLVLNLLLSTKIQADIGNDYLDTVLRGHQCVRVIHKNIQVLKKVLRFSLSGAFTICCCDQENAYRRDSSL